MGELLFNPNDRLTGRDGGPYLDIEQAKADEVRRAAKEGRDPELENPPANAGIPLSTAAQLLRAVDVNQPSAFHETEKSAKLAFQSSVDSDETLLKPMDELPDDYKSQAETNAEENEKKEPADDEHHPADPNAPVGADADVNIETENYDSTPEEPVSVTDKDVDNGDYLNESGHGTVDDTEGTGNADLDEVFADGSEDVTEDTLSDENK